MDSKLDGINQPNMKNPILDEIDGLVKMTSGKQQDFFLQMQKDAKPIKITSVTEIFSEKEIDYILAEIAPRKRECYRNASLLAKSFLGIGKGIEYVEGKVTVYGGISLDHAFNKIGDKYFDITLELALCKPFSAFESEYYVSLLECGVQELIEIENRTGVYGNIYAERYIENNVRRQATK